MGLYEFLSHYLIEKMLLYSIKILDL